MPLTIKVKTDNAAFEDDNLGPELARILRALAARVEEADGSDDNGLIFDINGNSVGTWVIR